jgi:multidrug resistance efflux pump
MRYFLAGCVIVGASMPIACGVLSGEVDTTASAEGEVSIQARRGSFEIRVPAKGELESLSASPIAVPRVPTGALKVKELIPEGSLVEEGDIVIVFDETQLNLQLANHQSSFQSANRRIDRTGLDAAIESGNLEVLREVAELTRDNAVNFALEDDEIFSQLEILEAEVDRDEAQETILYAKASLLLRGEFYDIEERILDVERRQSGGKIDRVETSLSNLVLRAPIGGLIVYRKNWRGGSVALGDSLWPGNVVMSIVDPSKTALKAFVLERDAAGIEEGTPAPVRVDAIPDTIFPGEVLSISKISRPIERDSPVKYFEVKIALTEGDFTRLKPGMKGEAQIETGQLEDAIVIPRAAVRGEGEQRYVLVRRLSGVTAQRVELGAGDQVLVSVGAGLAENERILLGGSEYDTLTPESVPESATISTDGDPG